MNFLDNNFWKVERHKPEDAADDVGVAVLEPEDDSQKKQSEWSSSPKEIDLERRLISGSSELNGGCNKSEIIELKDDGRAIFKPKEGEKQFDWKKVKAGTYYLRERAAYLVDRFLDLDLVPPTVIREVGGDLGSCQEFVPDAKPGWSASNEEKRNSRQQRTLMALFDCLTFNSDRHCNNFLIKSSSVIAIDNGMTFEHDKLRQEAIFDITAEDLQSEVVKQFKEKLKLFIESKNNSKLLKELLGELISSREIKAFFSRCHILLAKIDKRPEYLYLDKLPYQ